MSLVFPLLDVVLPLVLGHPLEQVCAELEDA
jgi:hypothetical protein